MKKPFSLFGETRSIWEKLEGTIENKKKNIADEWVKGYSHDKIIAKQGSGS